MPVTPSVRQPMLRGSGLSRSALRSRGGELPRRQSPRCRREGEAYAS
jgi:hypothetical protein